jgi:hypothetical protein
MGDLTLQNFLLLFHIEVTNGRPYAPKLFATLSHRGHQWSTLHSRAFCYSFTSRSPMVDLTLQSFLLFFHIEVTNGRPYTPELFAILSHRSHQWSTSHSRAFCYSFTSRFPMVDLTLQSFLLFFHIEVTNGRPYAPKLCAILSHRGYQWSTLHSKPFRYSFTSRSPLVDLTLQSFLLLFHIHVTNGRPYTPELFSTLSHRGHQWSTLHSKAFRYSFTSRSPMVDLTLQSFLLLFHIEVTNGRPYTPELFVTLSHRGYQWSTLHSKAFCYSFTSRLSMVDLTLQSFLLFFHIEVTNGRPYAPKLFAILSHRGYQWSTLHSKAFRYSFTSRSPMGDLTLQSSLLLFHIEVTNGRPYAPKLFATLSYRSHQWSTLNSKAFHYSFTSRLPMVDLTLQSFLLFFHIEVTNGRLYTPELFATPSHRSHQWSTLRSKAFCYSFTSKSPMVDLTLQSFLLLFHIEVTNVLYNA